MKLMAGGSSGIGRGAVDLFCSLGVHVVSADIQPSVDPLPKGAVFQKCNVKNWDDIKQVFETARKEFGSVDIVCANAGNNDKENLLKNDDTEPNWEILDVNLKGAMMSEISE
jgi:NAD(P)-dependent dehydrogenase (short-subunit alcohol dehydrogenase family)